MGTSRCESVSANHHAAGQQATEVSQVIAAAAGLARRRSSALAAASRAASFARARSRSMVTTVSVLMQSDSPAPKLGTLPSLHSRTSKACDMPRRPAARATVSVVSSMLSIAQS
jgi:hypothetical protein